MHDKPGSPTRPSTFLSVEHDEQKLAGYLGYSHTSQLRMLALSWPVVKAFLQFDEHQLQSDGAKEGVFNMLHHPNPAARHLFHIYNALPNRDWPIYKVDPVVEEANRNKIPSVNEFHRRAANRLNRYSRIAHILLHMEVDFIKYSRSSFEENQTESAIQMWALSRQLGVETPWRPTGALAHSLELHENEDRLERYNRLYNLLRYLQVSTKNGREDGSLWLRRFRTRNAMMDAEVVQPENVPKWMRPELQDRSPSPV
jgi:hypothetical protein